MTSPAGHHTHALDLLSTFARTAAGSRARSRGRRSVCIQKERAFNALRGGRSSGALIHRMYACSDRQPFKPGLTRPAPLSRLHIDSNTARKRLADVHSHPLCHCYPAPPTSPTLLKMGHALSVGTKEFQELSLIHISEPTRPY